LGRLYVVGNEKEKINRRTWKICFKNLLFYLKRQVIFITKEEG